MRIVEDKNGFTYILQHFFLARPGRTETFLGEGHVRDETVLNETFKLNHTFERYALLYTNNSSLPMKMNKSPVFPFLSAKPFFFLDAGVRTV